MIYRRTLAFAASRERLRRLRSARVSLICHFLFYSHFSLPPLCSGAPRGPAPGLVVRYRNRDLGRRAGTRLVPQNSLGIGVDRIEGERAPCKPDGCI